MHISKKRLRKTGLPPGSLVHVGEKKLEKVKITILDYSEKTFQEKEVKIVEDCFQFKDKPTVTWINVDGLHETEIIQKLGEHFDFHHLMLEDILNTEQRPKVEDFGNYLFVVLKMLSIEKGNRVKTEQVSLIIGANFVISFQEDVGDIFDPIRDRIRTGKGRIRKMGTDYLAYSLIDSIVDNYFSVLESLGERIEALQEELVVDPKPYTLKTLHEMKTEMIFLRKSVWPLREIIGFLERDESKIIKKETKIYLRDVYDHTIQVIDTVETFRDMLSGMLDIYLSSISNRLNAVMKVLTIITTIFMPLTFIAGIYGMNFRYMPELESPLGYTAVLILMAVIGISMLLYFKKKDWL